MITLGEKLGKQMNYVTRKRRTVRTIFSERILTVVNSGIDSGLRIDRLLPNRSLLTNCKDEYLHMTTIISENRWRSRLFKPHSKPRLLITFKA